VPVVVFCTLSLRVCVTTASVLLLVLCCLLPRSLLHLRPPPLSLVSLVLLLLHSPSPPHTSRFVLCWFVSVFYKLHNARLQNCRSRFWWCRQERMYFLLSCSLLVSLAKWWFVRRLASSPSNATPKLVPLVLSCYDAPIVCIVAVVRVVGRIVCVVFLCTFMFVSACGGGGCSPTVELVLIDALMISLLVRRLLLSNSYKVSSSKSMILPSKTGTFLQSHTHSHSHSHTDQAKTVVQIVISE
jgi:hypothetical protein